MCIHTFIHAYIQTYCMCMVYAWVTSYLCAMLVYVCRMLVYVCLYINTHIIHTYFHTLYIHTSYIHTYIYIPKDDDSKPFIQLGKPMYVCMFVCMCAYLYIPATVCVYVCMCVCMYVCMCTYLFTLKCVYVCVSALCVQIYTHIHMCTDDLCEPFVLWGNLVAAQTCIHTYTYIHTNTHT